MTSEEARRLLAQAVDDSKGSAYRHQVMGIADQRPPTRRPFQKRRFVTVCNADGTTNVVHVTEKYDGEPRFVFVKSHPEDSEWVYNLVSTDEPVSVPQPQWYRKSGRVGLPPWMPRISRLG